MNSENKLETSGTKLGWKLGLYFVVMLVILPIFFVVLERHYDKERQNYRENGYEVTATIVDVYEIQIRSIRRTRKTTKVIVEYQNPDGRLIRAGTKNPPSYTIGEQYIGKVVEDDPYLVYREVQNWKEGKVIFLIINVVFYLLNLLFLIILLRRIRANKLLASKGQITEAEMVEFVPVGGDIFVKVRFKDEKGFIHFESCRPLPYMDLTAKTCFVRYIITSKNKVDCEIISEKEN